MKCRGLAVLLALSLAACGDAPDAPAADATDAAVAVPAPTRSPIGPERHILAFGDSLFAGYGLKDGQSYPGAARGGSARTRHQRARDQRRRLG